MKIILFDPIVSGHHTQYAAYIIRYLLIMGDEVIFVTWMPDKLLDPIYAIGQAVSVQYIMGHSKVKFGGSALKCSWQLAQGIKYCFKLANAERADIVHHLYLDRSELSLYSQSIKLRGSKFKVFGTLFWPYFIHEAWEKVGLPKRLYHSMNRWALGQLFKRQKLTGLFVHSDRIKERLVRLYGDEALRQRIFVVPDPVEIPKEIPQKIAREHLGLPQDKPIVLFFGSLRWDKGPDILFKALPLVQEDFYTVVAGEVTNIGDAEQCVKNLQYPERLITRFGFISDADMAKYFAAADAVVLPYRRTFKGTSGILQHAAAAGKPVIATDVGEVGPTVREYGLGIVCEPESPVSLAKGIRKFLAEKDKIAKDVYPRALHYALANDWRIMAEGVREAYVTGVQG
jgi:glycosyltransferase involved in cell wall biosynthesis